LLGFLTAPQSSVLKTNLNFTSHHLHLTCSLPS
jgi:hypothetical protein